MHLTRGVESIISIPLDSSLDRLLAYQLQSSACCLQAAPVLTVTGGEVITHCKAITLRHISATCFADIKLPHSVSGEKVSVKCDVARYSLALGLLRTQFKCNPPKSVYYSLKPADGRVAGELFF